MSVARLLPLLFSSVLTACSILPRHEPVDTYLLPATTDPSAPNAQHLPLSLRVATPTASLQLNSTRIVVVPRDNELSVYHGARWSDPAPILLRNRVLDAFRADRRFAALSSDERILQADLELDSELRAFQSEYRGPMPDVVVSMDVLLVQSGSRHIVASKRFEIREKAAGTLVSQVVQAFGKASDTLARDVVAWAVEQAARQ